MKTAPTLVLAAILSAALQNAAAQNALIDGQVTRVDPAAGKVTIKHGPAPQLGMDEGMTMVYRARDPALLGGVKAGDRIRFDAGQVNGQYTVTHIEKTK